MVNNGFSIQIVFKGYFGVNGIHTNNPLFNIHKINMALLYNESI